MSWIGDEPERPTHAWAEFFAGAAVVVIVYAVVALWGILAAGGPN